MRALIALSLFLVVTWIGASTAAGDTPNAGLPLVKAKVLYVPDIYNYYPDVSRRDHEEGRGIAKICIDTGGRVISAAVWSSTGDLMLDTAMLQFAKDFRFKPATRGGAPVAECLLLPTKFEGL